MGQLIGFLATSFLGMTLLNRIAAGAFIEAADIAIANTLTITREQEVFGLFTIPIINTDFFFTGIPRLIKWDYSYFGGNAAIFSYFLYSLTFAVAFGLFTIIIGLISQWFLRSRI